MSSFGLILDSELEALSLDIPPRTMAMTPPTQQTQTVDFFPSPARMSPSILDRRNLSPMRIDTTLPLILSPGESPLPILTSTFQNLTLSFPSSPMTALTAPRAFPFGPTISSTFSPELPQLLSAPAWPGLPPNSPPPYCASPMAISSPFDMPALSISFDALPTRGRAPSRSNTSTSSTSSTSSRRFRVSPHPNILRQRRRVAGQFVVGLDSGSEDDSERPFFDFEP